MSAEETHAPIQEGKAQFAIAQAFYRPASKIGRDLAILAAAIYRQTNGQLRIIDAMTGCGVRALRYHLESGADWVWANEGNPDLRPLVQQNLAQAMAPNTYRISHQEANQLFFSCAQHKDYYDLIDIDSFGSPTPFITTALWAIKLGGLLYLTSTDGRTTSGHAPEKSVQIYGACARSHPAVHEQGLRLLIGSAAQQAAARGFAIEPVFSIFNGYIHRAMVRVVKQPWQNENYGFLAYCYGCGQFRTANWRQLGQLSCAACGSAPVVSGPMWLGPLHAAHYITQMADLAHQWQWPKPIQTLLQTLLDEAPMPPYYYPLPELGRRGHMDIPPRDRLIEALRHSGHRTTRTHLDAQAVKTEASLAACIDIAKSLI
ncbi:class I SAM-dependent methyltransferase [Leptothoe kymatousa]|uniref:tRNA (Guanine-N1)-methyltransferase n=1 Tax=Leptothoe kymatousa TAU-MAC 1615 TaxID=2364775 RepID=A0ABS5Y5W3_9CYAN|nr:tRNA (guanine-N1)-methyltransferase [Leptothoe kymatousa]MBT9313161.1 tRNA (guanine-N1)-methyltransferase [Leptothoe kymatousa TAU-MAC 1615]